MPVGRCAGCGKTSGSARVINAHVLECPEYKELYKTNPAAALSPQAEQQRWLTEDGKTQDQIATAQARALRAEAHREVNDRKLTSEALRWSAPTAQRATSRPVTTPDEGSSWGAQRGEIEPESLADLGKRVGAWRFNRTVQ